MGPVESVATTIWNSSELQPRQPSPPPVVVAPPPDSDYDDLDDEGGPQLLPILRVQLHILLHYFITILIKQTFYEIINFLSKIKTVGTLAL